MYRCAGRSMEVQPTVVRCTDALLRTRVERSARTFNPCSPFDPPGVAQLGYCHFRTGSRPSRRLSASRSARGWQPRAPAGRPPPCGVSPRPGRLACPRCLSRPAPGESHMRRAGTPRIVRARRGPGQRPGPNGARRTVLTSGTPPSPSFWRLAHLQHAGFPCCARWRSPHDCWWACCRSCYRPRCDNPVA